MKLPELKISSWNRHNDHSQAYERMVQHEDYQRNLLTALNDIHTKNILL